MSSSLFRHPTTLAILVTNTVLLAGTIVFGLDPLDVFAIYILETVIIGVYHILKLLMLAAMNKTGTHRIPKAPGFFGSIFLVAFFIFHFGMFVFVQTVLILPMKSGNFVATFLSLGNYIEAEGRWLLLFLVLLNGWSFIRYMFMDNTFEGREFNDILMEPYPRIMVQQFTVIFGGALLIGGGFKLAFIIFFILVKTAVELVIGLSQWKMPVSK